MAGAFLLLFGFIIVVIVIYVGLLLHAEGAAGGHLFCYFAHGHFVHGLLIFVMTLWLADCCAEQLCLTGLTQVPQPPVKHTAVIGCCSCHLACCVASTEMAGEN